jgi:cytochrome c553
MSAWSRGGVAGTILVAVVAASAGFLWFPSLEGGIGPDGLWGAICRAAGVPLATKPAQTPAVLASTVVVNQQMLGTASAVSIGRGATVAHKCAICHGAEGMSQADTPNLAGQFATAIYKELQDFKSGARSNAVMSPQVADLSEQDIRDVANYYAYLPRLPTDPQGVPAIIETGAPMRNIPPCAACHGGLDAKPGAPWLGGESANYLRAQLRAFADGSRRNDISEQMRNVARRMTPPEIEAAAGYYSRIPAP